MRRLGTALLRTEHQLLGMARRLGWGVADQSVSSMSNFAVSLVVAHSLPARDFGAFSLIFVTYTLVLNASRGLSTDPLLVRCSGEPGAAWRRGVAAATATAGAVGIGAGILCVLVGLLLPGTVGTGFVVLGAGLPLLMLQDSWRFAFFAIGRGDRALLVDVVWTVLAIAGLATLAVNGPTVATCMGVFVGTAGVAALFGLALCGVRPRPSLVRAWLHEHQSLGTRYLIENLAVGGSRQLRMIAISAVAGLTAVGTVRAAEILMGPFLVVLMGIAQVAVPELSEVVKTAPERLVRYGFAIGGIQAAIAVLWATMMVVLLPFGLGHVLLGDLWRPAYPLLLPVTLGVVTGCLSSGATSAVRALGASRRSLRAQLSTSTLVLVGSVAGAFIDAAAGSAWGWAVAAALGTGIWWWQLRRAVAEHIGTVPETTAPAVMIQEVAS